MYLTINDLQTIMRQCAGEAEDALPLQEAPDLPFDELGYDSLAVLETQGRIEREFGVALSEEELEGIKTAREFVDFVNSLLQVAA